MKKTMIALALLMTSEANAVSEWKWEDASINARGAAVSLIESYTHNNWLGIWANPNDGCNPTITLMEFPKDDWKKQSVSGELQVKVDDNALWFVDAEFVNKGEAVIVSMRMSDGLMDQFANGTEIIARARVERSEQWTTTIRFRLTGSSEALNDVIAMCLRLKNNNSDRAWDSYNEWQS